VVNNIPITINIYIYINYSQLFVVIILWIILVRIDGLGSSKEISHTASPVARLLFTDNDDHWSYHTYSVYTAATTVRLGKRWRWWYQSYLTAVISTKRNNTIKRRYRQSYLMYIISMIINISSNIIYHWRYHSAAAAFGLPVVVYSKTYYAVAAAVLRERALQT